MNSHVSEHKKLVLALLNGRGVPVPTQLEIAQEAKEERKKLRRPNPNPEQSATPVQQRKRRRMTNVEMTAYLSDIYGERAVQSRSCVTWASTMPDEGHPKKNAKLPYEEGPVYGVKAGPPVMFEPHPAEAMLSSSEIYDKVRAQLEPSTAKNRDGKRSAKEKENAEFRKEARRHKALMQQGEK